MEQHGISKLDLKRQNRMQVLKILKQKGPTSRIDIAAALELTRAAVTIITNEMIEQGIITEIGEFKHISEKAPRGRKKILIDINHNYKFVVGVSLEETTVSVGISTLAGDVLDKRSKEISPDETSDEIIAYSIDAIKDAISYNCLDTKQLLGIGIGILPVMYERLDIPVIDKVPDYTGFMQKCRQHTQLPIVIDNAVKGTAMANIDFQKVKDPNRHNIAFLRYGNGLNFVVTNLNDPIVSYDHRTDFVDKIIINPYSTRFCEHCKRYGCTKAEFAPDSLVKKASELISPTETPVLFELTMGDTSKLTLDMVILAYKRGDKPIIDMLNEATNLFATMLNNLFYTTNPQKLVLHNFTLDDYSFEILKKKLGEIAGEEVSSKLVLSIIDPKHQFLSGCALAIRELFFTKGGFDN